GHRPALVIQQAGAKGPGLVGPAPHGLLQVKLPGGVGPHHPVPVQDADIRRGGLGPVDHPVADQGAGGVLVVVAVRVPVHGQDGPHVGAHVGDLFGEAGAVGVLGKVGLEAVDVGGVDVRHIVAGVLVPELFQDVGGDGDRQVFA